MLFGGRWLLAAAVTSGEIALFVFVLICVVLFLLFFLWVQWTPSSKRTTCPYTGFPLRKARDLPEKLKIQVLRYLYRYHQYDNSLFDLDRAALCRETGKIFPNAVTWYGMIRLDWSFLQRRHPGQFISWGSLPPELRRDIEEEHGSLDGFQRESSCSKRDPAQVEPSYAWVKPGPLYVDLETKVLLGWKEVPETELEVMIVQHPKNRGMQ